MKIIMTLNNPLPGEKAEATVSRLAEFLNLDREDILVLPAGVEIHSVEAAPAKAKPHTTHKGEKS